jgi:hypothetical protein
MVWNISSEVIKKINYIISGIYVPKLYEFGTYVPKPPDENFISLEDLRVIKGDQNGNFLRSGLQHVRCLMEPDFHFLGLKTNSYDCSSLHKTYEKID